MKYKVLLFYKYTNIEDPKLLMNSQYEICQKLNLKGRMIIATEGINVTLEGMKEDIKKYQSELVKDKRFKDIHFKVSDGIGNAFPKLSIKIRSEIVTGGEILGNINPTKTTGKYLTAEQLHEWFVSGKEFFIVDMRNDYEQAVGFFENSILMKVSAFKQIPQLLSSIEHLKKKIIVTVCTGGVRCEKASGLLVENGFTDVYQLYGGIVTYMEKYPNEHFKGGLYVFDNRLVMGFNLDDPKREIVGKCVKCGAASENYVNCKDDFCHRHFIACVNCVDTDGKTFCPMGCRDFSKEHPEVQWI